MLHINELRFYSCGARGEDLARDRAKIADAEAAYLEEGVRGLRV
jgi:hypothetical protein